MNKFKQRLLHILKTANEWCIVTMQARLLPRDPCGWFSTWKRARAKYGLWETGVLPPASAYVTPAYVGVQSSAFVGHKNYLPYYTNYFALLIHSILFFIVIFTNPCYASNANPQADGANAYLKALTVFAQNGNSLSSLMDAFDSELLLLHRPGIITLPGPRAVGLFTNKPVALSESNQEGYDFHTTDGRITQMPITFKEYCFDLPDLLKKLTDLGWLAPKEFTVYGADYSHRGISKEWVVVWQADHKLRLIFQHGSCIKSMSMYWPQVDR